MYYDCTTVIEASTSAMATEASETTFQMLPCEMKSKIFNYLPFPDKKAGSLVCKQWWHILSWDKSMGYKVVLNDFTLKYVQRCSKSTIDRLLIGNLTTIALIISHFRTSGLPKSRAVALHSGISETNMFKILRYYCEASEVEELEFGSSSLAGAKLGRVACRTANSWNALRFLKIAISPSCSDEVLTRGSEFKAHTRSVAEFLQQANIPQLEKLSIILDYGAVRNFVSGETHPFEQVYINLFRFLMRHVERVKDLELGLKGSSIASFSVDDEVMSINGLGRLGIVKLDKLVMNVNIDEVGPYLVHFLNSQSTIKHFELNCQYWFIPADLIDILLDGFLPRNAATLESVTLLGIVHNVQWLLSCAALRDTRSGVTAATLRPLKSLNLVLINTNNLVRLMSRGPGPVPTPLWPQLSKFTLISYFGTPNVSNPTARHEQILVWIIAHMPNLEELDLVFRCLYIFTPNDVFMLLAGLKKLKVLCIHEPDVVALNEYCDNTPGITQRWVHKETDHKEILYEMKVDRAVWSK